MYWAGMNKQILLVAMETGVVHAVAATLRLAGHTVLTAGCGLDGIQQARNSLPNLILVDAKLPDMDGETLVDILRRLPSTAQLRTMLLKPRQPQRLGVNPSNLLEQIISALAHCQESPMNDVDSEEESRTRVV
jgi:CheY-like chemotaxis protein